MYVFNSPCTYGVLAHVFVQLCRYLAVYDLEDRQKLLEAYDDEVSSMFIVARKTIISYQKGSLEKVNEQIDFVFACVCAVIGHRCSFHIMASSVIYYSTHVH